jgi:hypothetical protein
MGIFDNLGGGSPQALPQLTRERVEGALRARDWKFSVDSDGDVWGIWDGNRFYFFITGRQKEILQIQSRWDRPLGVENRGEVLLAINEWHQTRLWPKGYIHVDDQGKVWVHGEHVVDWEHGVTDKQLELTINCAISTSLQLFEFMSERFGNS